MTDYTGDDVVADYESTPLKKIGKFNRKVSVERSVIDLARDRVRETFDLFDTVCVSFSGGKDSTVCLHLALEEAERRKRRLWVIHYDEEAIPLQTEEYVRRVSKMPGIDLDWYCLPVKHRNAGSRRHPFWYPWAPEDKTKWVRPLPPEAITELKDFPTEIKFRPSIPDSFGLVFDTMKHGRVGNIMGIRADESMMRTRALLMKHNDSRGYIRPWAMNSLGSGHFGITKSGQVRRTNPALLGAKMPAIFKVYPIYDWKTTDVWTAPNKYGWDYNCNPGGAPILMGDFRFKRIDAVRPGEIIIGWTEGEGRARMTRAVVKAVHGKLASCVKVTMASGRVIRCTSDHQWCSLPAHGTNSNWRYASAELGRRLAHIFDVPPPLPETLTRAAGWLGGIYDGEGSWDRIYQNRTHNPEVHARIGEAMTMLGISATALNERSAAQHGWRISGGRQSLVAFTNYCQPERAPEFDRFLLTGRFRTPDRVVAIEPTNVIEPVYALTTETGNYVAWGYGSSNSAYDAMEMAGISHKDQRCAPPYGEEPMQLLWMYATCFPEIWDKMCHRVPGAATAARYSKTELYAFGGRPEKPPGMTWPQFVRWAVMKHPQPYRTQIAESIQRWIDLHFSKTEDLIAPVTPHPISGISWEWILMVAIRGDYKGRKMPRLGLDNVGKMRARYSEEMATVNRAELM